MSSRSDVEAKVIRGAMTVNGAFLSIRHKETKAEALEKVRNFKVSATGPFDDIVVDAPWPEAGVPYPTMSIEEITAFMQNDVLPVSGPDASLWF